MADEQTSMTTPAPKSTREVVCRSCNKPAELVGGLAIYPHRPDLARLNFWRCVPCKAYVGCHGMGTEPKGWLATEEIRAARIRAHAAFDPLWKSGRMTRTDAYALLARELGFHPSECHIGHFDVATCAQVVSTSLRTAKGQQ